MMMLRRYLPVFPALFFVLCCQFAVASDLAREKRMASEIVDSIMDGDTVMLQAGDVEFLGIYAETDADKPRGAVLVLHGRGYHPNWPDVVYPVRVGLLEQGWNTLSIQLPVLEKEAKYNDYIPLFDASVGRIDSALAYLKEQGNDFIVMVAHSCGTHMANRWIKESDPDAIDAMVMIGLGATDKGQPMQDAFNLDRLKVPVLDIMGLDDFPAVKRYAPMRMMQITAADIYRSKQRVIPDSNHYFTDRGDVLVEVIGEWLDEHWPAAE